MGKVQQITSKKGRFDRFPPLYVYVFCRYGNEEADRRQRQLEREQAKRDRAAAAAADAKEAMKKVKHTQASIGQ